MSNKKNEKEFKFSNGDVVQLMTGGEEMTVSMLFIKDGDVMCAWFGEIDDRGLNMFSTGKRFIERRFSVECLKKVEK